MSTVIKEKRETILAIAASILFIAILIYSVYDHINWQYTNNIIHNPTFTGTVVGTETTTEQINRVWGGSVHRLHIIGEYTSGNETIQVDHVFVVSSDIFYQFEKGDTISHKNLHNR